MADMYSFDVKTELADDDFGPPAATADFAISSNSLNAAFVDAAADASPVACAALADDFPNRPPKMPRCENVMRACAALAEGSSMFGRRTGDDEA